MNPFDSIDKLNGSVLTPSKARRNLNVSFDYTSDYSPMSQSDTPILNYSIVKNTLDDEGETVKLNLKVSEKQFLPQVVIERLNLTLNRLNSPRTSHTKKETSLVVSSEDEIIDVETFEAEYTTNTRRSSQVSPPTKETASEEETFEKEYTRIRRSSRVSIPVMIFGNKRSNPSVRRSSRTLSRVSYNEYISPRKSSPRSCDSDEFLNTTPKKKTNKENRYLDEVSSPKATPTKMSKENKRKDNIIDINDIPKQKLLPRVSEEFISPSKLGFENISISSPGGTEKSARKRARKQNLKENLMVSTPSRRDRAVSFYNETENVIRPTRRSTRLNSKQEVADLDDRFINMKFTDDEDEPAPKTPRKSVNKLKETQVHKTPKTPGSRMQMIRNGEITPSMHNRQTAIVKAVTPLNLAKEKLHVSYVPKALPCREKEFADILSFVEGKLQDGCGGCMYISGVPGTGKTATVTEAIRQLETMSKKRKIPKFTYVSINGMRLTEPRQSYVEILKQLTGKTIVWEQAYNMLDIRFTKSKSKHHRTDKDDPVVLLVDELDILCTKRQDVVYNLLDWPTKSTAQLIVITIANTMDLPERLLMGRVTSRLGLTRLTFQAYTHKQLQEIVLKRLMGTNIFNPDAIQLVARKVASVSGDARRALDICRRSAEIAELEGPNTLVSMQHVNDALNAMITQPKIRAMKCCSRLEQLLLQSVAAEVERTGVDETTFSDVYTMFTSIAGIVGFRMVSITLALSAISRLGACRLLITDQKSNALHQRLILNVSADDIYYALRKD